MAGSLYRRGGGRHHVLDNNEGVGVEMTPENFCYWLRGRTENRDVEPPTEDEWRVILAHLGMVFGEPLQLEEQPQEGPEPAEELEKQPQCQHHWSYSALTEEAVCLRCGAKVVSKGLVC